VSHKFEVDKHAVFIEHHEQLKDTLSENESLLFMDAVHPTQATKIKSG
jgi:ABC-type transport system involved in cytochrome c biogenesis ATPase subunit